MDDRDCVDFLQWALPQMGMRWPGFRRVRRQVCRRLNRRLKELRVLSIRNYRRYLQEDPEEWKVLDNLCRVTISRFYRDKQVFAVLEKEVLPELAEQVSTGRERQLNLWSIGCASGEEPYTLALLWFFVLGTRFPGVELKILATDSAPDLLERACRACYPYSSVKELPQDWLEKAFRKSDDSYCLKRQFKTPVEFRQHDVRRELPEGPFHLVLCRNLVFTYFTAPIQRVFLEKVEGSLSHGGILLIGKHESLPGDQDIFEELRSSSGIYRRL